MVATFMLFGYDTHEKRRNKKYLRIPGFTPGRIAILRPGSRSGR
jgi:hypothetical protein